MSYSNSGLLDIGQPPGIPVRNNSEEAYNNYIRKCMKVVDLIPLYFEIDIASLFEEESVSGLDTITTNYEWGISEFNRKLEAIGHPDANSLYGVRVWLTSSSSADESVSNDYRKNNIIGLYDKIRDMSQQNPLLDARGKVMDPRADGFLASLADSKQLSAPDVWQGTSYSPKISLTTKMTSPYGDPTSYKNNIVRPLLALISLLSPTSTDGITYGIPPYFTVKAYGNMNINLGKLDDFSITRSSAETRYNAKKQPLEIEVSMSFSPALPGFAGMTQSDFVSYNDVDIPASLASSEIKGSIPGITTIGSIIESLRPASPDTISESSINGVNFASNIFSTNISDYNASSFETDTSDNTQYWTDIEASLMGKVGVSEDQEL